MNAALPKIYTLTKPPSPDNPFLDPIRHALIIHTFNHESNACHILNYCGDVDFYILTLNDDFFDGFYQEAEEFALRIPTKNSSNIEIGYSEGNLEGAFRFDVREPFDYYILKKMVEKKEHDIYFIRAAEEEYVCIGVKKVYFPSMLCYDIQRFLHGKAPLLMPRCNQNLLLDTQLSEEAILNEAWCFSLNFSGLKERIGDAQDAEEVISRHLLDGIARLQKSRKKTAEHCLFVWAGKKNALNKKGAPCEYYNIYISDAPSIENSMNTQAKRTIEKPLRDLPEYEDCLRKSPLGDEALPIACLRGKFLYRIELTRICIRRLARLYQTVHLPSEGYLSHYQSIMNSAEGTLRSNKIYNIFGKHHRK